ncbi:MAG: hypothetical protein HC899_29100 [Leptolyngbyaceae cyanobacterium SM1_4_3]|nr:hypothetical protein [Leptolyngbyaceae cyanobacterium SM1_4_3]
MNEHFSKPLQTAQPRELAIKLGIEYSQVIAILAVLAADGYCRNWLLIYHNCSETFVDRVPLREGMPKLPYVCPYCEVTIYNYDELKLDVMAETEISVEFV